jgi:hypothetical protein
MKKPYLCASMLLLVFIASSCNSGGGSNNNNSSSGNTAALTWKASTTNADGTPLTDLAGYKIHYGTSSGSYTQTIDAGNVTTYQVADLPSGATYYFTVTAYNQAGIESDPSSEGSKSIN